MIKAVVFFDLDGTLLRDDKSLSQQNIDAINELKKHDVLPVISTGRNIFEIQYVIDTTGINSLVSANGSYVQLNGKKLKAEEIPDDVLLELIDYARQRNDILAFYNNKEFALTDQNDATTENYKLLSLKPHTDPNFYKKNPVNFLNVFNYDKDKMYQDHFAGKLSLVRNNPRCMDTMNWGVSKKTGIRQLLGADNLSDVPTYAFGDQKNDLQMFDEVDYPVAMGNGIAAIKDKAAFVSTSNMEDGIVRGLKHFKLI